MELKNKRVLVVGAGISGFAAAKEAKHFGAHVILYDAKEEQEIKYDLTELINRGIELKLGRQQDDILVNVDYLIVSPGVPIGIPLIEQARAGGIEILGEIEFAYRLSEAPIYAITGTNGKTTTTALTGDLVKRLYKVVGIGGNIGCPLCSEAVRVGSDGCIVAEISSYQLESAAEFRPQIAAILNLTPDHLARHGSMDVYREMKERIFARQTRHDFLVLNYDDEVVREMAARTDSMVMFFSRKEILPEGAFVQDGWITVVWKGQTYRVCAVEHIKIKGSHNIENALAAVAIAFLAGVAISDMAEVLAEFPGVEHRIEPVTTIDHVAYYNDSKATNPESAIKALEAFSARIILIAGGHDKHTDLTPFMALVREKVEHLILIGDAAARFKDAAVNGGMESMKIHEMGYSMEDAVHLAHRLAKPSQVVLLSPACASFDMFEGFEERGKVFKDLVYRLS